MVGLCNIFSRFITFHKHLYIDNRQHDSVVKLYLFRCVPGSSVLTPDNRKWLDSQGHKSPEISRKRIIIGQQSFTFGQDGDLIESQSPPSSLTDSDRYTSVSTTVLHAY